MVGTAARVRRQAGAGAIDPETAQADLLGALHIPVEAVPDHPGPARIHAQGLQGMAEDPLIRLAAAELAFDHHHAKEPLEIMTGDLVALETSVAVGDQPERDAAFPHPYERGQRVGEELLGGAAPGREVLSDLTGEPVGRRAQALQAEPGDLGPGADHVGPLEAMALGI